MFNIQVFMLIGFFILAEICCQMPKWFRRLRGKAHSK